MGSNDIVIIWRFDFYWFYLVKASEGGNGARYMIRGPSVKDPKIFTLFTCVVWFQRVSYAVIYHSLFFFAPLNHVHKLL